MRKTDKSIIQKIKHLRNIGYSVPEISKEVQISKTTVLRNIKGIEVLPEYISQWSGKRGGSKKRMLLKIEKALEDAEAVVGKLSEKEKLLILSTLYWAEGNKKDFILTNTDPELIRVFVSILRQDLKLNDDQIRVSIRIYEDLDQERSLNFWSEIVGIPKEKFLGVNILSGKKKGKLEYGMCRVRVVKGGDLLKKVNGINRIIAKRFREL